MRAEDPVANPAVTVARPFSSTLAINGLLELYRVPLINVLKLTVCAFTNTPMVVNCVVWPLLSLFCAAVTFKATGIGVLGRQKISLVYVTKESVGKAKAVSPTVPSEQTTRTRLGGGGGVPMLLPGMLYSVKL